MNTIYFLNVNYYSELRKELIDYAVNTIDNFGGLNESMKLGILSTSYHVIRKNFKFCTKGTRNKTKTFKNMNISRTLSYPNDHNLSVLNL